MPNDDYYIICPYYYKTMGNMLFCEAFSADERISTSASYIKQCFKDRKKRNECMKKYCASFKYVQCRIALVNEILAEDKKHNILR